MNPGTWEQRRDDLPADLPYEASELIRKATAAERHLWRVEQASIAARKMAAELLGSDIPSISASDPDPLGAAMWLSASLEVMGVGGPLGIAGHATARLPAFSDLGKGRKQASDGGAYTAAIAVVAQEYSSNFFRLELDGTLDIVDRRDKRVLAEINLANIPRPWLEALARRAILVLAEAMPARLSSDLDHHIYKKAAAEELVAWSEVLATCQLAGRQEAEASEAAELAVYLRAAAALEAGEMPELPNTWFGDRAEAARQVEEAIAGAPRHIVQAARDLEASQAG